VTNIIDKLTTINYRVLKILYDNQTTLTDGSTFAPITQLEIAQILGISNITVNSIFKDLMKDNLIYLYEGKRGRYCLSDSAKSIVEAIDKLSNGRE